MSTMQTITIPKTEYQTLIRDAMIYRRVLRKSTNEYPIEEYTDERIREFLLNDKTPVRLQSKVRKFLSKK